MNNRRKTNNQLFPEYFDIVAAAKSPKWDYETRRILTMFWHDIGEFPPTMALFTRHFQRYSHLAQNTRARYYYVFLGFFNWYSGERIPFKIKSTRKPPQVVPDGNIEQLIATIKNKKTHKKTIERDVLLIKTSQNTGLRAAELSELEAGDLHLQGNDPQLHVRKGKGNKERDIPLNDSILGDLQSFTRHMKPTQKVFGLATKTISLKIGIWARKSGVPIHTHSLRHNFAEDILRAGGDIRKVQVLLGHESLSITESYLGVTDEELKDTVRLLDKKDKNRKKTPGNTSGDSAEAGEPRSTGDPTSQDKIRAAARTAAREIGGPSYMDKSLWRSLPVEFKPEKYNLSIGLIVIDTDKKIEVKYPDVLGTAAPPHIKKNLLAHLASSGMPRFEDLTGVRGGLAKLSDMSAKYSLNLMRLLKTIAEDIAATNENIWFHGEQKPGLTSDFIVTVWVDAIERAEGREWIRNSWYAAPIVIPEIDLLQQSCGGFTIGFAADQPAFAAQDTLHKLLRRRYAKHRLTNNLPVQNREITDLVLDLRERLEEFSDFRELPGRCELC